MDQNEYRAKKESGQSEEVEQDAAVQEEETEIVEEEVKETEEAEQETVESDEVVSDDDDIDLPEEQKTAFAKRLEREQKKIREAAEKELSEKYESQYGKHKSIVDMLGGDPDQVEQMIRDNQAKAKAQREAQSLAQQYDWTEEQAQQYVQQQVEQQRKDQKLADLEVQVQINELKDNPDYAGIASMKKEIQAMIARSNGSLSVEQAYWAMGGSKKAEQIRLEAQMRESEKRKKTPRTVLTDSQTSTTGEKPLAPEVLKDAERMGISAEEARRLMKNEPAMNIDDWRAKRKK